MKRTLFPLLALLLLVVMPLAAFAQSGNPITATVDASSLTTDDVLTLNVSVDASNGTPPQPTMPLLDGFNLVGSSMSTNMTFINNVVTGTVNYLYFLQPTRTGTLAIQPFTVSINGQTYSTLPIFVQVTQGQALPTSQAGPATQPPAATQAPAALSAPQQQPTASGPISTSALDGRIFVEAVIDDPTPYIGQQVLYKFRLYQSEMLGQPSYVAPSFTGFWNNQQSAQTEYLATVNNQRYRVTELTNVLFPTASGNVTIDPADLTIPATFNTPILRLQTEPLQLDVQPLPDGAPAGFEGAVGDYSISVRTDTSMIDGTNDSVTLQVTISGAGNMEALPNPAFPEDSDWRVYDTKATVDAAFLNGVYRGSRMVEYTLVPTAEGEVTIPPVSFVYFDPNTATYNTISTNAMSVTVAPGAAQAPAQAPTTQATAAPTQTPVPTPVTPDADTPDVVDSALPQPRRADDGLTSVPRPLIREWVFWLLWLIPVIAFIGELIIRRRERYLDANENQIRSSQALKKARKALAQARRKPEDAHGAAARILNGYLSDKLNRPVVGMTRYALTQALLERGISSALIDRIETCLSASEAGRYGGPARTEDNGRAVLNETERLLKELDREFAS